MILNIILDDLSMIFRCGDLFGNKFQHFPTSVGEGFMCELRCQQWQHPVSNTGYLDVGEKTCAWHVWYIGSIYTSSRSLLLCGTLRWDGKHIDILQSQTIWTKNRIVVIKDRDGCEFKLVLLQHFLRLVRFPFSPPPRKSAKLMVCRCISVLQVDIWQVPC